jgi:uncharacterized membrane protein YoaK (UPF0700 family)
VHRNQPSSLHSYARLALLCFVAGFIDVVGFVSVLGVFLAHVTGNLTVIGSAFTRHDSTVVLKLSLLPVFIIALALATIVNHWARVRRFNPERILLAIEAVCLVGFMFGGAMVQHQLHPIPPTNMSIVAVAALAVFAMGVHNSVTREARSMPATTAMTANLVQFVTDVTDLWVSAPNRRLTRLHAQRGAVVLGSFVVGATVGTVTFLRWQFWSVALPIGLIVLLAITPPAYSPIPLPRRGARPAEPEGR